MRKSEHPDIARNADRLAPYRGVRDRLSARIEEPFRAGGSGRFLASIEARQPLVAGIVVHQKPAPADTGGLRLDHGQRDRGGDRRVGRAAALAEDLAPRLRRSWVRGRDRAAFGGLDRGRSRSGRAGVEEEQREREAEGPQRVHQAVDHDARH
jgi:hypothetical protein